MSKSTSNLPTLINPLTGQPYPQFEFDSGPYFKNASGELRKPSIAITARDLAAQRAMSAGTGEHAGHLIGTQFGAPGDARNLGLQNASMNSYAWKRDQEALGGKGGSYLEFEYHWTDLLENDIRVKVLVTDNYRAGENRPFSRDVLWWTINPGHSEWIQMPSNLVFGNFSSRRAREAAAKK